MKQLDIQYKGERKYLHGTDLYSVIDSLSDEYAGDDDFFLSQLSLRKTIRNSVCIVKEVDNTINNVVGHGYFSSTHSNANRVKFYIVETDNVIDKNYAFDEDKLLQFVEFKYDQNIASTQVQDEFSIIENIIILTKYLNYKIMPVVNGKWLFGQIDLEYPLDKRYQNLDIKLKNYISNRYSVSDILLDEVYYGKIRFVVGGT